MEKLEISGDKKQVVQFLMWFSQKLQFTFMRSLYFYREYLKVIR